MANETIYTTKEVAERLKVSEPTIKRWAAQGLLKAVKMGKGWRISQQELDRVLREGIAPESPPPARAGKSN